MEIVLAVLGIAIGAALASIGTMILYHLKSVEERNRADHARLFDAVSGLQPEVANLKAVVNVFKDRSDRSDRAERADSA